MSPPPEKFNFDRHIQNLKNIRTGIEEGKNPTKEVLKEVEANFQIFFPFSPEKIIASMGRLGEDDPVDPVEIMVEPATIIALIEAGLLGRDLWKWFKENGYLRIPFSEKRVKGDFYDIEEPTRRGFARHLSENVPARNYGFVFGRIDRKGVRRIKGFLTLEQLKGVGPLVEVCNELLEKLQEIEEDDEAKNGKRDIKGIQQRIGRIVEIIQTQLMVRVEGDLTGAPISLKPVEAHTELKKYAEGRILGMYFRSRHIQKSNLPIELLRPINLDELRKKGAIIQSDIRRSLIVRRGYEDIILGALDTLDDKIDKPMIVGFCGIIDEKDLEELKKKLQKPEKFTSSVAFKIVDGELRRILSAMHLVEAEEEE
ncbi:MAG: hypothetical protein CL963_01185 [Euryarchaeota archaeon]|jgi:hypothetical protein|nr:hypothetical protein [Euryarchaeota archaeon]HIK01105.1 hypothetical protein [Candidatus Undinarchaeales archaeon ERR594346 U_76725]|tara:strand:- start:6504 stop:7610 length:1107 start_codon:yes stop_codon:yes gene_type:complete